MSETPALSGVADTETAATLHAPLVETPSPTTTMGAAILPSADTPTPTTAPPAAPALMVAPDATLVPTTTVVPVSAPTSVSNPSAPINTNEISTSVDGADSEPTTTLTPAPAPNTTEVGGSSSVQVSQDEPQSSLTKKFTVAEWEALVEFRNELPTIFAAAYPEKPKADITPITIWGISVDPANPRQDPRVSVILMKFLRARNLNIRAAGAMLTNTLRWRASFNIEAALKEDFPQEVFGNLGHLFGRDKENRPVVYNVYGGNQDLKTVFGDVNRFIRWRIALMERSVDQLDFLEVDQTVQIHDYEGVTLTSRDANSKAAASEATNLFQSHYPELLHKKIFINVPTILNWIFWAFKPLLSPNTLAKMSVVGTSHHSIKKALSEHIDISELPSRYGGEANAF